jgi:hypothetical protein
MRAALSACAGWHAHFWLAPCCAGGYSDTLEELAGSVWDSAGYCDLAKQPEGQANSVASGWELILAELRSDAICGKDFSSDVWDQLGQSLQALAWPINDAVHKGEKQCILHGDMKVTQIP